MPDSFFAHDDLRPRGAGCELALDGRRHQVLEISTFSLQSDSTDWLLPPGLSSPHSPARAGARLRRPGVGLRSLKEYRQCKPGPSPRDSPLQMRLRYPTIQPRRLSAALVTL